jgi:RNA polymerase sigma-70 factor (ECF subfamily)
MILTTVYSANSPWAVPVSTHIALPVFESASDGELVQWVLKGQADAYGTLVRRYQLTVYNIALRMAGNRQDALDLSQDAFVRAYNGLRGFDRTRPFGPWVNRIVTNLALNWLQQRRPLLQSIDAEDESEDGPVQLPDETANPERLLIAGEQHERLAQALMSLTPNYRVIIELRHYQGFSYDEIATTLAIPLSDVKSRLFRARRHLRTWLEAHP